MRDKLSNMSRYHIMIDSGLDSAGKILFIFDACTHLPQKL